MALTRTASGVWLVPVRVNGHPARLRLALDAPRSGLESSFRQRIGATQGAPELLATLELAAEVTSQQLFQPLDTDAPGDGVLGFDALAMSRWILDLAAARLTVAPADLPVRGTIFDYPSLRETHWARVRLIRDGVGALLLLMPRLDGRVVSAALDVSGDTVVDARQRPFLDSEEPASRAIDTGESGGQLGRRADGDTVRVEIRFGGWREDWPVTLADLYPRARKGWVAPQMVLGGDLLAGWVLRWSPEARQLTLTPAVNGE